MPSVFVRHAVATLRRPSCVPSGAQSTTMPPPSMPPFTPPSWAPVYVPSALPNTPPSTPISTSVCGPSIHAGIISSKCPRYGQPCRPASRPRAMRPQPRTRIPGHSPDIPEQSKILGIPLFPSPQTIPPNRMRPTRTTRMLRAKHACFSKATTPFRNAKRGATRGC